MVNCVFFFSLSLWSRDSSFSKDFAKTSSVALAATSCRIGVIYREIAQNHVLDEALLAPNASLFLLWSFGLLTVRSLANTWSRRISRTALSSACESFCKAACYLHAWAALFLLAFQLPFTFGFLPFMQIRCCLAVQTAFAAVFAVESLALVIQ